MIAFWIHWRQFRTCIQQLFKDLDISLSSMLVALIHVHKYPSRIEEPCCVLHRELTLSSNDGPWVRELAQVWKLSN